MRAVAGFAALVAALATTAIAESPIILKGVVDLPVITGELASCENILAPSDLVRWQEGCLTVPLAELPAAARTYMDWLAANGWAHVGVYSGEDWFERPDGAGRCKTIVVKTSTWAAEGTRGTVSFWFAPGRNCRKPAAT